MASGRLAKSGLWSMFIDGVMDFPVSQQRPRSLRGIVIYGSGQPQLLSNATSGYGFHATASRRSQLVQSRSLSSDAHSTDTPVVSPVALALDQSTTWRGIGGAAVHDALATRQVELWSATHEPPLCPQAHRRSRTAEGPAQRGHLLTGAGARQRAVGNARVATPGSVSRLDTAGV